MLPGFEGPACRVLKPLMLALAVAALAGCASPQEKAERYYDQARQQYEAGDLVRARLELRNALQVAPRHARSHYLLALISEREQEYPAVLGELLMAVESDPAFVDARVKLGNYYAVGLKGAETRAQADAAMKLAPNDPSVRLLNARAFYVEGERDKALGEVRNVLRLAPDRGDAYTLGASIHAEAGRSDEALAMLDEGIAGVGSEGAESLRRVRVALLVQLGKTALAEQELQALARAYPKAAAYDVALARLYAGQNRVSEAEERIRSLVDRDPENAQWRVQLAGLLANQQKTADAEQVLSKAIAERPGSAILKFALASLYEANQKPDDAVAIYESIATADPKSPDGLAARSRLISATLARDPDRARKMVAETLKDIPDNADALLFRAAFSYQDGKFDEAIADSRSVLARQPDSERALLLLARTFVRKGDATLAEDTYRRLLRQNPMAAEARSELAAVVAGRGDLAEAEQQLRDALKADPGNRPAAGNLIAALLGQGNFKDAESEARRLVESGDASGRADYQLGIALQMQGQNDAAIAALRRAFERSPETDQPLSDLVRLLVRVGRGDEAEQLLKDLIRRYPNHTGAQVLLGTVYRDTNRADAARGIFEQVIKAKPATLGAYVGLASLYPAEAKERVAALDAAHRRDPADSAVALALGAAHEKRGEYDRAIAVYESTVKAGRADDFVATNLVILLLDSRKDAGSHRRALELAQQRFDENTRHPYQLAARGWAHFRNAQFAEAQQYLERAMAAATDDNPQLHYYLGMVYEQTGNEVGARREFAAAVKSADAGKLNFAGLADARARLVARR